MLKVSGDSCQAGLDSQLNEMRREYGTQLGNLDEELRVAREQ